jgi:hypothetical protein
MSFAAGRRRSVLGKRGVSTVSFASLLKSGAYRSFGHSNPALDALTDSIIEESSKHRGDPEDQIKTIGDILNIFVEGRLEVFPKYQRGAVLNADWARDLVRLILFTSAPINPVMLRERVDPDGTKRYEVVDGAQRLTAILLFAMGALAVRLRGGSGETSVYGWASEAGPAGYEYLFGGGNSLGCADYFDDGTRVHDSMFRFAARAGGLVTMGGAESVVMEAGDAGRFLNKSIRLIIFPTSWPDKLCILYAMYTELKHIRQTKDECLLHLHDLASQALKPLAPIADAAAASLGIEGSSKPYGWLFKVYAMLDGLEMVPTDENERHYMDMMCLTVKKYINSPPCPSKVARIKTAVVSLRALAAQVKVRFKKTKLKPDVACILLWKLVTEPSADAGTLSNVAYYASRRTPTELEDAGKDVLGEEGSKRAAESFKVARLSGNLYTMAVVASSVA